MAHIKADAEVTLTTAEALALVKNASGKVRFQVRVSAFLPTEDSRGFDGITYISVPRSQMLKVIKSVCGEVLEGRGARIRLRLAAPRFDGCLSFISLA